MNKKVKYRVWFHLDKLFLENEIVEGHAEMLSLKRLLKRQGFKVEVERYEDGQE